MVLAEPRLVLEPADVSLVVPGCCGLNLGMNFVSTKPPSSYRARQQRCVEGHADEDIQYLEARHVARVLIDEFPEL